MPSLFMLPSLTSIWRKGWVGGSGWFAIDVNPWQYEYFRYFDLQIASPWFYELQCFWLSKCNVFNTLPLTRQTFRSPRGYVIVIYTLPAGYLSSLDYVCIKLGGIWVFHTECTTTTKVYLQTDKDFYIRYCTYITTDWR